MHLKSLLLKMTYTGFRAFIHFYLFIYFEVIKSMTLYRNAITKKLNIIYKLLNICHIVIEICPHELRFIIMFSERLHIYMLFIERSHLSFWKKDTILKCKKRGYLLHQPQRTFFTVSSALRMVHILISSKSQATKEWEEGLQIMKELN